MRMSIVALAVLGGSAACASAQNEPVRPYAEGAGAGAIQEAVCGPDCLGELQLAARAETVPAE